MDVREATPEDGDAIRDVARRSMEASYSLSPNTIESAVEKWYDDETLAEKFDDDDYLLLVTEEGAVFGFAEVLLSSVDDEADLLWLHVAPENRGQGAGEALFEAVQETIDERDIGHLRGRVLADNAEGNDFYERHGFERAGETEVEIDGSPYVENIYVEEVTDLEPFTGPGGEDLFIDHADTERGSRGEMASVYRDPDSGGRYGYYCTNCDNLVTSMDSMGRMECGECGNHSKPTRWDAAYL